MKESPRPVPASSALPLEVSTNERRTLSGWNEATGETQSVTLEGPVTAFRLQTVQREKWYDRFGQHAKVFGKLALGATLLLVIYKTDFAGVFASTERPATLTPKFSDAPAVQPPPSQTAPVLLNPVAAAQPPAERAVAASKPSDTAKISSGVQVSVPTPRSVPGAKGQPTRTPPAGLAGIQPRAEMRPRVSSLESPPHASAAPTEPLPSPPPTAAKGAVSASQKGPTAVAIAPKATGFHARVPSIRTVAPKPVDPE